MKIVVLDGHTLNSGDLDWNALSALGELTVYDRTAPEQLVERLAGANIALTNKTPIRAEALKFLPDLQYIGVLATGYDVIDIAEARLHNIVVTNVPSYSTDSVAQLVFALLLELCHRSQWHDDAVKRGAWETCADFSFRNHPLVELSGKTMGIIGYGRIGEQVGKIAEAFGMKVAYTKRTPAVTEAAQRFTRMELDELLRTSDVVSLHCPLHAETTGMINTDKLSIMKPSAFLINTARGKLIVERDLADALNEGLIAGAGLDVLSTEPPAAANPLLRAKHCVITPHIAWATKEARVRLMDVAVANVQAFLQGNPENQV